MTDEELRSYVEACLAEHGLRTEWAAGVLAFQEAWNGQVEDIVSCLSQVVRSCEDLTCRQTTR